MDAATLAQANVNARRLSRLATRGNGTIWALGDSITADGNTIPTGSAGWSWGPLSYLMHAVLNSGGRLRFGGIAATAGYTSAQIVATHLPTVLAARPQFCVVHAGTNDTSGLTEADTRTNLRLIYESLLRAGITPIATSMLPKHTEISSSAARLQRLSLFAQREAERLGIPFVNLRTLFAQESNDEWLAYSGGTGTFNRDDTHPNEAGAEAIGNAVLTALTDLLPAGLPWLPTASINTGALQPCASNALNLTDTSADGIPDQWSTAGTVPGGSTFSLTAMSAPARGNWFNVTRPAGATDLAVQTNPVTVVPGNRMYLALRVKTANVVANGAAWDVRFVKSDQTTDLFSIKVWKRDVAAGILAGEFVVPTGITAAKFLVTLRTAAMSLSLGQIALYDLTANGLV